MSRRATAVENRLTALAAAATVASAVALASSRFHLVPTADGVWRGITDPPGPWPLLAAALAGGAAWLAAVRLPALASPLLALGAALLPVVPIVAGRWPLLLVFQGPVLAVVAAAVACVLLVRAGPLRAAVARPPGAAALFAAGLAFYLLLGRFVPGPAGPQGDEPHYLVMAQSLLRDFDLDLANQFRERQYATFFAGTLEPHTSPRSPAGRLYSIHAPGLPALLLPAFAGFGYAGAMAAISALAALTGVLVHRLARDVLGSQQLALATWALVTFTPPLPFYAVAIYPEVPAALATAFFLLASRRTPSARWLAGAAAAAAALVWIHPKFLPLSALGLLLCLLRPCSWRARALALIALGASVGMLLFFFARFYGTPSLSAAYGPGFASDVALRNTPRGALGLLADRQFGLLAVSPLWALAAPGLLALWARRTGDALRALLLLASTFLVGASFSMWWGGSCPPARFVVPGVPALALLLAAALPRRPQLAAGLFGISLAVVLVASHSPRALHNRADGESGLLRVLAPALDLDPSLPSFVVPQGQGPLLLLTAAAGGVLSWRFGAKGAALGALAYMLVAAGARDRPLLDARAAPLELLARWDGANTRGAWAFDPARLAIPLELPRAPWTFEEGELRNSRPLDLPPGRYEVRIDARVTEALRTARVMTLDLRAGGLLLERRYLREDEPLHPIPLLLPGGARRLLLAGTGIQGKGVVDSASIVPVAVVRRGAREAFQWPRRPEEELYRLENGGVRATALDLVARADGGFQADGPARFVVEARDGAAVRVEVVREAPHAGDVLEWGEARVPLGRLGSVSLEMPADAGEDLAGLRLVQVRFVAEGGRITFSGLTAAAPAAHSPGHGPPAGRR